MTLLDHGFEKLNRNGYVVLFKAVRNLVIIINRSCETAAHYKSERCPASRLHSFVRIDLGERLFDLVRHAVQVAPSPVGAPQLTQLVQEAPTGAHWLHEIKLDGFRMAARIERGKAQLLTRTGLDWSVKYPSLLTALAAVRAKTAYLDGELCGVGDDGLPSFAETQAATDGARGVRLVFYAFDLLHLDGRDTGRLPLIERKALLEPIVAGLPCLQFNGHEIGDGELVGRHACQLGFEDIVSKTAAGPRGVRSFGVAAVGARILGYLAVVR
jgi:ATP-dependent DNA ligase